MNLFKINSIKIMPMDQMSVFELDSLPFGPSKYISGGAYNNCLQI